MTLKLYNGYEIPALGLGTWNSKPGEVENAVKVAIDCGYKHIDCAFVYGNEREVGNALKERIGTVIDRKDLFVTSKLWNTKHDPEDVEPALRKSLADLQLDYLDLYLIHWPIAFEKGDDNFPKNKDGSMRYGYAKHADIWAVLEKCVEQGLVRSIGLSNFNSKQISAICSQAKIQPVVLQVECHPYLNQEQLIDFCKKKNIVVTAYSPLGSLDRPWANDGDPRVLEDKTLEEIGKKYGKSVAQVCIRFQLQRGISVIPKSSNPVRIKQNAEVFDFELSNEDIEKIRSLNVPWRAGAPKIIVNGVEKARDGNHPNYPFDEPF